MNLYAKRFLIIPVCATLILSAACSRFDENGESKHYGEGAGTVLGAVVGGLLGSGVGGGRGKTLAMAVGAIMGAIAGKELGKMIDETDFSKSEEVAQGSLENNSDGETSTWSNPDSGNSGTITPQTTFKMEDGMNCRDFESTINVDGKSKVAHGRACRQPDGSWKIVNQG